MMNPEQIENVLEKMHFKNKYSCSEMKDEVVPETERTTQVIPMGSFYDVTDEFFPEPVLTHFTNILRFEQFSEPKTMTSTIKADFITSLVQKESDIDHSQNQDKVCSSDCKIKEITVDYCASLHSLSPTEMNIRVKGFVPSRKSRRNNFSLQKGSLEQAFLGNIEKNRLIFQVINIEFDVVIKCVKIELTDGGEYSGNCIFSEELTRVEKYVNLWSVIELLEYDIISDKFLQIRKFQVLKNMTVMIGDPDPDPIEDALYLKIHKGDYPISSCRHNKVHRNQMGETLVRSSSSSGSLQTVAVPCPPPSKLDLDVNNISPGTLKTPLGDCSPETPKGMLKDCSPGPLKGRLTDCRSGILKTPLRDSSPVILKTPLRHSSPGTLKKRIKDCSPETLKGRLRDIKRLKECRLAKLKKLTGQYRDNMAELYFLETGRNMADLPLFRQQPTQHFLSYLKSNKAPSRVVSEVQEEVMGVTPIAAPTLPGSTPTISSFRQTWRGFSSTQPVFLL